MLPATPLLQLVPARVKRALDRLRGQIWTPLAELPIDAAPPTVEHRPWSAARRARFAPVRSLPHHWGKLWDQRWFRLRVLPALARREGLFLHWRDQAEATVHLAGRPHYGIDVAHPYAPLPRATREVWIEAVVCQTGLWHPAATGIDSAGSRLEGAALVARDDTAWGAYHDLLALDELMRDELRVHFGEDAGKFGAIGTRPVIAAVSPLLRRLLRALDEAVDALDSDGPAALRRSLVRTYRSLPAAPTSLHAVLTGHAHIDLVWLWPERVGDFKAVHTFATADRLMERYPEFRFGYSQPASYEAAFGRAPALAPIVRRRLRQSRWEAVGATEVESDTLLACGEALARSFIIGQRRFAALRGSPSRLLWLPDVFGYAPCLPQIMRQTGVDFFYTTKLTWSAVTRFPHSSFVWRGHDGSEVVAHITHDLGYNQEATAAQLRRGELAHRQSDVHDEFLAPTGFGDGGGGPTEEMCERARRFANLAGVPRARWGRIEDFFERLAARRDRLPVHQGELYLEYHRGTFTTHGDIKAAFRAGEVALQTHEAVRCVRGGRPLDETAWRRLVYAQFHDYIPGSSIHEVYDEARTELTGLARDARAAAARELGTARGQPALFNPLPRPRLVVLGPTRHGGVEAAQLPPLAGAPLTALDRLLGLEPVHSRPDHLANGRLVAAFDALGRVKQLAVDGRPLALRAPLGELVVYPDHPHAFDAWDIDRQTLALSQPVRTPATLTLAESGPARAVLAVTRSLGAAGHVTLRWILEAGATALRVELDLDWRRPQALLKLLFPTAYAGRFARYGCPFGSVLRPQVPGTAADEAMWEVPASRWAAVMDEGERDGLFVVTENKYGFAVRDGCLGMSLVRSAAITAGGAESHGTRSHPATLRRTHPASPYADIGCHRIALAIGRYDAGARRDEQPAALADLLFTPPIAYDGREIAAGAAGFLGLEGGESLQPVWARPLGRGRWVLRLNETLGQRGRARLRLAPGWSAEAVDLLERPCPGVLRGDRISYGPYALLGVRLSRA
jgi:alpha-mannosidase